MGDGDRLRRELGPIWDTEALKQPEADRPNTLDQLACPLLIA
jgi:hypothetical protein